MVRWRQRGQRKSGVETVAFREDWELLEHAVHPVKVSDREWIQACSSQDHPDEGHKDGDDQRTTGQA